ncbi:MAG: HAMP domain-containing protein [Chloroflexi bacterium]|nr:HAMP domain-containing protein [Chloroflexota bacterium]
MTSTAIEKTKNRQPFVSLQIKMLIGLTLILSILFGLAFWWISNLAQSIALNRVESDLVSTLQGAVDGVNTEELETLRDEAFALAEQYMEADGLDREAAFARAAEELADDPRVESQLDWLEEVRNIEQRAWGYIYFPGYDDEPNSYIPVADLWIREDPARAFSFLDYSISSRGFLINGFDELFRHPDNFPDGYVDDWGEWVTAYAPIVNAEGETIAAMGVDFQADYVREVRTTVQQRVTVVIVIGYVSLIVAALGFSMLFTRPIKELASAAERIGEGDYDQDIANASIGPASDELTTLSHVFEIMVDKVREREQKLRREVEELRIIVDKSKVDEQVESIVENEFFQELQTRARDLRRSRKVRSEELDDQDTTE